MNNRVDYLSDRLVNLRGKLKSVDEVIPPESIANGVSVAAGKTSSAPERSTGSPNNAQLRRWEQTRDLYGDLEQRLVRRTAYLEARLLQLQQTQQQLQQLRERLSSCQQTLAGIELKDAAAMSPMELGDCYRNIDRTRLEFFALESEIELLSSDEVRNSQAGEKAAAPAVESFALMLKRGLAQALTVGMVMAVAVLAAALIIYLSWR